jgi:hypothetical protein
MSSLTRRQLQNLKVAVAASVHGELVRSPKYRSNPELAASKALEHAEAAVAAHRNGKRNGK